MNYHIAVDTGGTFTDVVVVDENGALSLTKAPTNPEHPFRGVYEGLEYAAIEHGVPVERLLAQASTLKYGTTVAINAILTGRTGRTAFLTTQGHPDILSLREGGKVDPFDFRTPFTPPYVPRRLTFEVPERIGPEGEVLRPLDVDATRALLRSVRDAGAETIAVCLLWSIANPAHEELVGRLVEEELPGVPYTLSHQLNPIIREYRRASSTAIDASLKTVVNHHFARIEADSREAGFSGEFLVVTSFGGVLGVDEVVARPIYVVNSGPSMAPVAGRKFAGEDREVVVCDTGGTSFDVSVIRDGYITFTRESWLGERFGGHITGISAVGVKSIGAGGGSIAWIDSGGLIRVGPQSAGAVPGPVCYGRGGEEPTVTDAAAVLGYVNPDNFLGGRLRLDVAGAREAIRTRLAEPLGIEIERAAYAIMAVANESMVKAIREISINEGIDAREATLVAGGGAAGFNMVKIAEELGNRRLVVPRVAGGLSACGAQFSDAVMEFTVSCRSDTNAFDREKVNAALQGLDEQMDAFLDRLNVPVGRAQKELFVEARYAHQMWELEVRVPVERFETDDDVTALVDAFHAAHERVFAVREPGQYVECLQWKGRASAELVKPEVQPRGGMEGDAPEILQVRKAFFGDQAMDASCYAGASIGPGARVEGPAIIEEPTTTIVVYPGWDAELTENGTYVLSPSGDA